jgi:sarcosine oxidase subunit gamma
MSAHLALSPVAELATASLVPAERAADVAARLGMADLSDLARHGCKGPGAAQWLAALGLPVPDAPNTWLPLEDGGRIARLGLTEFLVEGSASRLDAVMAAPRAAGVYPVLRQDAALVLTGDRLDELLRQTCSVNFRPLDPADRPVVLTSMVGVAVTAIPERLAGRPALRLWCDGTYGHYLWETLLEIAIELGGGAIAPHGLD